MFNINSNFIQEFIQYCNLRNWKFDRYSSEFTFQFRIARYFDERFKNITLELESNINRHNLFNLSKKEIDIEINHQPNTKYAIEIKYIRDSGTFNIGMINYLEDIKFIEELKSTKVFEGGVAILFTCIPQMYNVPNQRLNPKNAENLELYKDFRIENRITNKVYQLRTGNFYKQIKLDGEYSIKWDEFKDGIKYCVINIV